MVIALPADTGGASISKSQDLSLKRHTRYQGAVIDGHRVLLILHQEHSSGRAYWVFPGGGIEAGESGPECVRREVREETNLEVTVERLVLDEEGHPDGVYHRLKTYLCQPVSGEPSPGFEPEPLAAANYAIAEVRWFDLRDESGWDESGWDERLRGDRFTYPLLIKLREALGYET